MSEERGRYEAMKTRASLSGWLDGAEEDLSRRKEEAASEYLERFKSYGPADLMALLELSNQRLESHRSMYEELDTDSELRDQVRTAYHSERGRRRAIQILLGEHLLLGPSFEISSIGDLSSRIAAIDLPEKTRSYLQYAALVAANEMSVDAIVREVADEKAVSYSTAYKWLCDRNPRYEANKSESERLNTLLDLMDEVGTSREVE